MVTTSVSFVILLVLFRAGAGLSLEWSALLALLACIIYNVVDIRNDIHKLYLHLTKKDDSLR